MINNKYFPYIIIIEYMEEINNNLPINLRDFLNKLRGYVGLPIYYYGSIQRTDFLIGNSDIDASIFCNDINSTILKLITFLTSKTNGKIKRKQIIWRIDNNIVYGSRLVYKDDPTNLRMEINIFDEKYKNLIIKQEQREINLPFFISAILLIVKTIFYKFRLMDLSTYKLCKTFLLNTLMGNKKDDFVSL